MNDDGTGWLVRDPLPRTRPDRRAANYYRSAADDGHGKDDHAIGGIPLSSAESAVVAAVRMAYRVAEVQIDRSARLAQRLREAGDQATGPGSDRRALDATERLVRKAMMAVLQWIETAAAERGSPLKRLVTAQYRLLGAVLGLTPADGEEAEESSPRVPPSATDAPPSASFGDPTAERPRPSMRIQHVGNERRAVRIAGWEYTGDHQRQRTMPVTFYNVEGHSLPPLHAEIVIGDGRSVTLKLATSRSVAGGRWRAALCEDDGLQVGHIEILL